MTPSTILVSLMLGGLFLPFLASCSVGGTPVHGGEPVPEGAQNPIEIGFSGASVPEVTQLVASAMAAEAIPTRIVHEGRGYVESNWIDVFDYVRVTAPGYTAEERTIQFKINVEESSNGERRVVISGVYRPILTDRDRRLPTDHPGFTLQRRLADKLRIGMISANVVVVDDEGG